MGVSKYLRVLEVVVTPFEPSSFQWQVLDSGTFVIAGISPTRAAAKLRGECAMFWLWASNYGNEQPY